MISFAKIGDTKFLYNKVFRSVADQGLQIFCNILLNCLYSLGLMDYDQWDSALFHGDSRERQKRVVERERGWHVAQSFAPDLNPGCCCKDAASMLFVRAFLPTPHNFPGRLPSFIALSQFSPMVTIVLFFDKCSHLLAVTTCFLALYSMFFCCSVAPGDGRRNGKEKEILKFQTSWKNYCFFQKVS